MRVVGDEVAAGEQFGGFVARVDLLGDWAEEETVVLVLPIDAHREGQDGQLPPLALLTPPHQPHHPHVLLHNLLRTAVDNGQTVKTRQIVLSHVLLEELVRQPQKPLGGVVEDFVPLVELLPEIGVGGQLAVPELVDLEEDIQAQLLQLLLLLAEEFAEGGHVVVQYFPGGAALHHPQQMGQLQVVLEVAVVRLVEALVFAPLDCVGELPPSDAVPQGQRLPEEPRRVHLSLDLPPNAGALPLPAPQVVLHDHFLQYLQLVGSVQETSEEMAEFLLLAELERMGRLLAVGAATVAGAEDGIFGVVGELDLADEVGELSVVVHEVLPDCFQRLQGE